MDPFFVDNGRLILFWRILFWWILFWLDPILVGSFFGGSFFGRSCLLSREGGSFFGRCLSPSLPAKLAPSGSQLLNFSINKISPEFKLHCSSPHPTTQPPGIIYLMQIGKLNRSEIWNMIDTDFCRPRSSTLVRCQIINHQSKRLLITNPISPFIW